jgi:hypothetical protein
MQRTFLAAVLVVTCACGAGDGIAEHSNALSPAMGHRDLVLSDSVDCGTFFDNYTDYFSIDIRRFFDRNGTNIRTEWSVVHTSDDVNSVTGYTIHENDREVLTFDWVNGTLIERGKTTSIIQKGEGMVIHDIGRLVFDLDTFDAVFVAGRHDVLLLGDQAFCNALSP